MTAEQMRAMDQRTIEGVGVPGVVLMERASLGAVSALREHFADSLEPGDRIGLLVGAGNNGGDGYTMARILLQQGFEIVLGQLADPGQLTGDAKINAEALSNLAGLESGMAVHRIFAADHPRAALQAMAPCKVWVDALLGTGLDRALEGRYAEAVHFLNEHMDVLAVDIPSGLDAVRGQPLGPCVEAEATVTFALPKLGQALDPGRSYCGTLYVVDIGIPDAVVDEIGTAAIWLNDVWAPGQLKPRPLATHKGDAGRVSVLAGSPGKAGAALLTARGALLAGAGLITVGSYAAVQPIVAAAVPEIMAEVVLGEGADHGALDVLLDTADVVALGPGLGGDIAAQELLHATFAAAPQRLVLDADGLNIMATHHDLRQALARYAEEHAVVLTPHPGEMARLVDVPTSEVIADPIGVASKLARELGVVVVLKGGATVIASPEGRLAVNGSGNPGMASAGMGDVLTGVVAALMAQVPDPFQAAAMAVWSHGAAGDAVAARFGHEATTASSVLDHLHDAFAQMR